MFYDDRYAPDCSFETQAEHDTRHPGLVCQRCPKTLESQRRLRGVADRLRRPPWWRRWF